MAKLSKGQVDFINASTATAYSRNRYRSWNSCMQVLADHGCGIDTIVWVMNSKHMRWAADQASTHGNVSSTVLKDYLLRNYPDAGTLKHEMETGA